MNKISLRKGFKRLTWAVSIASVLFSPLFFDIFDFYEDIMEKSEDLLGGSGLILGGFFSFFFFFIVVWIIYFFLRFIVNGFVKET